MNAKHKENDDEDIHEESGQRTAFTADILIDLVNDLKTTISKKKVFTTAVRDEISSYRFNTIARDRKSLKFYSLFLMDLQKMETLKSFIRSITLI